MKVCDVCGSYFEDTVGEETPEGREGDDEGVKTHPEIRLRKIDDDM
jgi:hypothetical protein